ncbi:MAG: cohesin domain-containing protein, partial [Pseudomonadota bacterium]|nr:cohesin domain-containing protein [Pseudomonadota bacterium]
WFNFQHTDCNGTQLATETKVTGSQLLVTDFTLDVALFTVNDFDTIAEFGYLELDVRTPTEAEEIYIPQHGAGNPKEFGIESDQVNNNLCQINQAIVDGRGFDTDSSYLCDTIGGSSGAPVLARNTHKVIVLHHLGGCPNKGVRIERLWPIIEPYLEGPVVEFGASQYSVAENEGFIEIPVRYIGEPQSTASANYIVNGGNAVQGIDYSLPDVNTLNWENETSDKLLMINVFDNKIEDKNRTLELSLANLTGIANGMHETTTITITDDEALKFCSQPIPPLIIPYDNNPDDAQAVQLTDTLTITEDHPIGDLNVAIRSTHSWVGDLSFSLKHVETGTEVALIQNPNNGNGGCSGDDIDVILDDEAEFSIQDQCQSPIAYPEPYYQPAGSLADFNYQTLKGTWVLTATDAYSADEGELVEWCLLPEKGEQVQLKAVNQPPPVCPGDTFDVSFQMTLPEGIMATQVDLRFDPTQLQAVDVVNNSSILNFMLDQEPLNNSDGYFKFTAAHFGDTPPAAGTTFELFTLTFKALVESQNTELYFEPNNTFTLSSEGHTLSQQSHPLSVQLMCQPEFQVQLQHLVSQPASDWQMPLTIQIPSVGDYETTVQNGQGKLPQALASGAYSACIKGLNTLQKQINFTMPSNLIDFGILKEGDIDDNNQIDLWDFVLLYLSRNSCSTDANYLPPADLNGDNCINIDDAELLKAHFGLSGDSCEPAASAPVNPEGSTERRRSQTDQIALLIPAPVTVGQQIDIPIQIQAAPNQPVSAAMAHLNFDPTKLQINSIQPGSQLDFTLQNDFDNERGQVDIVAVLWSNEAATQAFTLATLKVTVLQSGGEQSLSLAQASQAVSLNQTEATAEHISIAKARCQLYAVNYQDNHSQLFTVGLEDHHPITTLGNAYPQQHITALAIERTQDHIYAVATLPYSSETGLYRVDGQNGLLTLVGKIGYSGITDISFNAEGRLWGWAEAGLIAIDPQSGKGALVLPAYSKEIKVGGLTLSPDKSALFFGITGADLWQYNM